MEKKFIALKPFNNKVYYKNAIFNEHSSTGSHYLIAARKLLAKNNIIINTMDIPIDTPTQKDVYMDVPYPWEIKLWAKIIKNIKKNILFIVEPPIINPFNYMQIFQLPFSKIYTWDDNIVDQRKYFKYFPPVSTTYIKTKQIPFKNKKLLVMMNMNWLPFLPFKLLSFSTKELYSKRLEALNFFDANYPSDFSLYGRGWNKPQRFSIKQRSFGYRKYRTYQGEFLSKDKYKILSRFKFCLCFDNCDSMGNISEKIFDCFKTHCVPVYLGARNVTDFISEKCFIDFRRFKNYEDLAEYLNIMDENTYNIYQRNIEKFLLNKEFLERWSSDAFAKVLLKAIS